MDTEWTILLQIRIPILEEWGWWGCGRSSVGWRQKGLGQYMGFASSKQDKKLHVACLSRFPPYESKPEAETHRGQLNMRMMLEGGRKLVTCSMVMQRTWLDLGRFGVEFPSSYKSHKLQGIAIMDSQQPWPTRAFRNDDVGNMEPAKPCSPP